MVTTRTVSAEYIMGIVEARKFWRHLPPEERVEMAPDFLRNIKETMRAFSPGPVKDCLRGERDFWKHQIKRMKDDRSMTISGPMTLEQCKWHARWRAASGHPSGRWRVCREFFLPLKPPPGTFRFQEACGPKGHVRLFKSEAAARKAAKILNEKAEAAE